MHTPPPSRTDAELPRTPPTQPPGPLPSRGPQPEPVPERLPGELPDPSREPTEAPVPLQAAADVPVPCDPQSLTLPIGSSLDDVERAFIVATLEHFGGDKRRAANVLGCSVKTLYNKLHLYRRQLGPIAAAS